MIAQGIIQAKQQRFNSDTRHTDPGDIIGERARRNRGGMTHEKKNKARAHRLSDDQADQQVR